MEMGGGMDLPVIWASKYDCHAIQKQLYTKYEYLNTWNPKQPFLNGCLVKQPFPT